MTNRSVLPLIAAALLCCAVPVRSQSTLPEGPGRELVTAHCLACHGASQITRSGHDRDGWRNTVAMMINAGAKLPANQVDAVVDYLAKNFPAKAESTAVIVPGSVQVSIREWVVPTAGSRPHDPLAAPDGSIWYTGQMANVLGRVDPKTGAIREFHPAVAGSGPHGLVMDRDGDIWFTANFKAYIGKLDPRTGAVTQYKLPDPAARDPHTRYNAVAELHRTHLRVLLAAAGGTGNLGVQADALLALLEPGYVEHQLSDRGLSLRALGDAWESLARKLCGR